MRAEISTRAHRGVGREMPRSRVIFIEYSAHDGLNNTMALTAFRAAMIIIAKRRYQTRESPADIINGGARGNHLDPRL